MVSTGVHLHYCQSYYSAGVFPVAAVVAVSAGACTCISRKLAANIYAFPTRSGVDCLHKVLCGVLFYRTGHGEY